MAARKKSDLEQNPLVVACSGMELFPQVSFPSICMKTREFIDTSLKLLGCPRKLGSMVSNWVISPTYKWGIPWGYNPLILTFEPNFQGHPSTSTTIHQISVSHESDPINPSKSHAPTVFTASDEFVKKTERTSLRRRAATQGRGKPEKTALMFLQS